MWKLQTSKKDTSPFLTSLNGFNGRQTWEFVPGAGTSEERAEVERLRTAFTENRLTQRQSADELLRMQYRQKLSWRPLPSIKPEEATNSADYVQRALQDGMNFYETLQAEDGHWAGDYGGPMFLMPGLIISCYITGALNMVLSQQHKTEMRRYPEQPPEQRRGFGLHIEGPSTMFGTALSYVSLRILGMDAGDPVCEGARAWIHSRGGAVNTPSWGKFWLATLGAYAWEGLNPLPPEMWLLPYASLDWHWPRPSRALLVPLPHGVPAHELYLEPYSGIKWDTHRNACAAEDEFYPHPWVQNLMWWGISRIEPWLHNSYLRKRALKEASTLIHYEDENTRYVCIGPVNKTLNMLAVWLEDPSGDSFKRYLDATQVC
ncbi:hypothetical protein WJX73_010574 [Symbiochloris irregularis]|uniref:Squalene cyclase N-terminal domain-containing protein n=1 Tax=Symbiochloris irregularis TaxID=706552 RepID=A0AAW1NUL4_9CHLO